MHYMVTEYKHQASIQNFHIIQYTNLFFCTISSRSCHCKSTEDSKHVQTNQLNCHFPGETGLASSPLIFFLQFFRLMWSLSEQTKLYTSSLTASHHHVLPSNSINLNHCTTFDLIQELSSCWYGRLFGHNRHGPKSGGGGCCSPFPGEAGSPCNTM